MELGPGAIIELDKMAGEAVDIYVNGKSIAKGEVVVIDENYGVRITEILSSTETVSYTHLDVYKRQLFELGELTTNLASGGEKKYVKVNIVFELNDKSLEKEIKEKLPVLSDRIIVLLNSKKSDDLSAENRAKLKNEILSNLNTVLTTGKLEDIYFSDLVMQ